MGKPALVAHRGFAGEYPENSLSAFQAAIDCGCQFLELDVQITKDHKAVVIHDTTLRRTGGSDKAIFTSSLFELQDEKIGEASRFGDKFQNERLPSLADFVSLLQANPSVHAFVEIKEECIEHFGVNAVLMIVCEAIEAVKKQCSLISFDASVLFEAKKNTDYRLGYVMHCYDDAHSVTAKALAPEILICNYKKIPDDDHSLWAGDWDWFLYEIIDPGIAKKWHDRGVTYIETMQIESMIKALN